MDILVIILIVVVLGMAGMVLKYYRIAQNAGKAKEGLNEYNKRKQEEIVVAKEKIIEMIEKDGEVNNQDVADMLKMSDSTAIRYLDELEGEGKVKQVGKTGRSVFYEKVS